MKIYQVKFFGILFIMLFIGACSEDIMDEIDTDPNNPTDVPINLLIPNVTSAVPFNVTGTDLAWYSSIFVEQTAGVHGQMRDADRRASINSQLGENAWGFYIYPKILKDLKIIIDKGSEGGNEEGNWHNVGIAQVLMAYTMFVVTDTWGRVPYTEAFKGAGDRYPVYDTQESVYDAMLDMLDNAITNLSKTESIASPGSEDYIFEGEPGKWIKTAYALKARYSNRLSNIYPEQSAEDALQSISNAFEGPQDNFTFRNWGADINHQNPWYQEEQERKHHAVSETLFDIMEGLNDPRIGIWFTLVNGLFVPAPNGEAAQDQAGLIYSRMSSNVIHPTAPLPIMTYDELKFIEAECHLRKATPDPAAALQAYEEGIEAAMERVNVFPGNINSYKAQEEVLPSNANDLTLEHIIMQKYVALWPYGSIEAYADWRRTGYPVLSNPLGDPPLRFPYPQNEISGNGENVPQVTVHDGVWWDDGSED